MAYDFSNIKTIIRNGTELSKITNSAGTIIWQKKYVWKRYNVKTKKESYISGTTTERINSFKSGNLYKSMSFNESTGMYTLSDPSGTVDVGAETPYDAFQMAYALRNNGTSGGIVWSGDFYNKGYKYYADNLSTKDVVICMINSQPKYSNQWPITVYMVRDGASSQGSYIDLVTSTNSNAYPTNGISGDYWYVKQ